MLKRIYLIILSVTLLLLPLSAFADTGYSIENYSLFVQLQPDGSADVCESLVYSFDGEYNGILSLFDTDGTGGLENLQVFIDSKPMTPVDEMTMIDSTYTVTPLSENISEVRIYSPGDGDRRTVVYEYTLLDLAKRYADTGMLHRKLIGENNSVALQNAAIVVAFPENIPAEVFVHSEASVSHRIEDSRVVFSASSVQPGDSVEVRLLFPGEWLSEAPLIDEPMYQTAIDEEQRIAEEERLRNLRTENAKYTFAVVYILVFFSAWLLMAKKYGLKGRLHETPSPDRVRQYPAAFLTAAVDEEADTDALSGTLMELVAAGIVRMEPEGEGLLFTLLSRDTASLYPHQAALIDWLFEGRDFFLLSELNAGKDYERAQQFEAGYNRYITQVSADMLAGGLRYKNDSLRITLNSLIIVLGAMGVGGILLAGTPNIFLGLITGGMLFLLIRLMSCVRRLTDEGERLQAAAEAFKNAGVSLESNYSDCIAFYAALGMTEPLVESIERGCSDSSIDDMPVWMFTGWYYSLHTLNSSMRDFHHHNASIPNPNASSSSGSSGGSGNGGGGGHGAW